MKEAGAPYQIGDFFDEEVTPKDFGRIAAQTAKQVIVQRIREAERDTVYNKYVRKLNDFVTGTVQRYEQRNMYITLEGRDEAVMYLDEQVPGESYRINDFIRAYVLDVKKSPKGPQVILSRAAEGLVQRLLELEVPEIADGTVEIMAIARDPGSRSKVAVKSNRAEVDPIGACLGPKSSRIANVTDNLRGEKVDIIRYDAAPATFIMNALAPAKVIGVELFEDDGVALVIVPDYQLSLAIGRDGQNVRLAARLTGWRLDIASESESAEARERYLAERDERTSTEQPLEEVAREAKRPKRRRDRCRAHSQARRVPSRALGKRRGLSSRYAPASVVARRFAQADSFAIRACARAGWRPIRRSARRKQPGRGAYLCSPACAERAAKNKRYPGLGVAAAECGLIESSWKKLAR